MELWGSQFIISGYTTFGETRKGTKSKYLKMKEYEIMVRNTWFEVDVPVRETRDDEEV